VIKDTIDQAYSIVHSYSYTGSAYDKAEQLATSILTKLQPLQNRLPLAKVDSYANAGLDYVEKKFPAVKEETNALVGKVKKPADDAVGIAKIYAEGVQNVSNPLPDWEQETEEGLMKRMRVKWGRLGWDVWWSEFDSARRFGGGGARGPGRDKPNFARQN